MRRECGQVEVVDWIERGSEQVAAEGSRMSWCGPVKEGDCVLMKLEWVMME